MTQKRFYLFLSLLILILWIMPTGEYIKENEGIKSKSDSLTNIKIKVK